MSGLVQPLRAIARNLPSVAQSLGFAARVTSGYRSSRKQAELYDRYLRGLQPYPVAPPGTSDHERGLAIDVVSTDIAQLVRLLASVGLSWAGPADPVHFSLAPRKSQARAISAASASWTSGPGASIPAALSYLPGGLGTAFSVARDPWGTAKNLGKTLLTAITGGWL